MEAAHGEQAHPCPPGTAAGSKTELAPRGRQRNFPDLHIGVLRCRPLALSGTNEDRDPFLFVHSDRTADDGNSSGPTSSSASEGEGCGAQTQDRAEGRPNRARTVES